MPRGDTPLCNVPSTRSRSAHASPGAWRAWNLCGVRGPRPGIQGFLRMLRSPTGWRRVTWKRRQGASCSEQDLNVIEFTYIKMAIRIGYVWKS